MPSAALGGLYPSMSRSNVTYRDLKRSEIRLITRILSLVPPPTAAPDSALVKSYQEHTSKDLKKLQWYPHLSSGMVSAALGRSFAMAVETFSFSSTHEGTQLGKRLCALHCSLNPALIKSIFGFVRYEVEEGIPRYIKPLFDSGDMPEQHASLFQNLNAIRQMWMTQESYDKLSPYNDERWCPQQDGCLACILGRIGGNKPIVLALRAGILARMKTSRLRGLGSARLSFVTGWLKLHGDEFNGLVEMSYSIGMTVKEMVGIARRNARHAAARDGSFGQVGEDDDEHDGFDEDLAIGDLTYEFQHLNADTNPADSRPRSARASSDILAFTNENNPDLRQARAQYQSHSPKSPPPESPTLSEKIDVLLGELNSIPGVVSADDNSSLPAKATGTTKTGQLTSDHPSASAYSASEYSRPSRTSMDEGPPPPAGGASIFSRFAWGKSGKKQSTPKPKKRREHRKEDSKAEPAPESRPQRGKRGSDADSIGTRWSDMYG